VNDPLHRRELSRKRSRRRRWLIAAVVVVAVLGGAALAVELTRHHSSQKVAVLSFPASTARPAATTISGAAEPGKHVARLHLSHPRHKPAPQRNLRHRQREAPATTSSDVQASFARLAATLPGSVGVAIEPLAGGPISAYGQLQVGHAWSTMKVPVLATVLRRSGGKFDQQALAARALEASDNAAAEALFADLERTQGGLDGASLAVQDTLRNSGDAATTVNTAPNTEGFTTWGQSEWSASDEVRFYRSLARGCLLDSGQTRYVLNLMSEVEADQRWGAGSAALPAQLPLGFKGGWGPEADGRYLVRQTVIAGSGDQGYVFSMLAKPSDGQFATGTELLTDVAHWVGQKFPMTATHSDRGC
jgi:hypothetical protein